VLVIDSDWELFPQTLQRLHEIVETLPQGIRVVRARLILDDGQVTPYTVPGGPITYADRLRWVEEEGVTTTSVASIAVSLTLTLTYTTVEARWRPCTN
jgi:hypothetical protein